MIWVCPLVHKHSAPTSTNSLAQKIGPPRRMQVLVRRFHRQGLWAFHCKCGTFTISNKILSKSNPSCTFSICLGIKLKYHNFL